MNDFRTQRLIFWLSISIFAVIGLPAILGCSLGALMVQATTPTPTPQRTPKPTFTHTPNWTPTFTPSVTPTPSHTPTVTDTPIPTDTPVPEEEPAEEAAAPVQQAPTEPPPPAEPTDTPTPEEPTATPTPAFPFSAVFKAYNTGSPGETRFTAWIRIDYEPGKFKTLSGFQMKAIAPDGNTYYSEVSGSGFSDSTVAGAGDNNWMNTKLEISPYTPGKYTLFLVENDAQMSPELEFELSADPLQYLHFEFFKQE